MDWDRCETCCNFKLPGSARRVLVARLPHSHLLTGTLSSHCASRARVFCNAGRDKRVTSGLIRVQSRYKHQPGCSDIGPG